MSVKVIQFMQHFSVHHRGGLYIGKVVFIFKNNQFCRNNEWLQKKDERIIPKKMISYRD